MGNYSLGNLLQREPVAIAGALRSILWLAVLLGWVEGLDEAALAGIALTAEVVLGLFARNATTPTAGPRLEAGTEVAISGTNDTVRLAAPPKPSTPIEGGQDNGLTGPDQPADGP